MFSNFPNKKYQVIYADPPWSYYNDSNATVDCTTIKGVRRPPYSVLSTESIKKLPVSSIADENCILFIWSTDYHLDKCMQVINSWGFLYKTIAFVWAKKNKNGTQVSFCGAYTLKSGCELCLLATKGKNAHKMVKTHNISGFLESPRQQHSKKPDEIRTRIEKLLPDTTKIELFARNIYPGWDCWGNEV